MSCGINCFKGLRSEVENVFEYNLQIKSILLNSSIVYRDNFSYLAHQHD